MAIAFDATSGLGFAQPGTSVTLSHTCTGSNLILFVGAAQASATATLTATYNGVSMTAIDLQNNVGGTTRSRLFYLLNPATGANNIVVSSDVNADLYVAGCSYTGVNQSGQPDASNKNSDNSSPYRVSVTSVADNCWMIMWLGDANHSAAITAEAGTTVRTSSFSSISALCDSGGVITPAGSKTLGVTAGTHDYGIIGATFKPVAAAANGNFLNFM